MQHTTIGNTTTFYSTTEESRINKSVPAANIKFLVKFTNEFSKNFVYAYAQNQNINNRFTSFDINHGTSEDILTGTVNLSPAGYWSYEIFEISFVGTPSLTDSTVPLDENTTLAPSDDHGINNGLIEIGKVLSSETALGKEITYLENESPADDSYIYPYADSGVSNVVNGCTDINANNYNANATIDDGSCAYHVYGCMDINANNQNPLATIENGSCTYDISGCTDPAATNYNANATIDDGNCTYPSTFSNVNSIQFDGATNYITCVNSTDYKTSTISAFAWVKLDPWNGQPNQTFFSTKQGLSGWSLSLMAGQLTTTCVIGGVSKLVQGGYNQLKAGNSQGTANNWHHVGFTFDGQFLKQYVDGALDTSNGTGTIDLGSTGNTIAYAPSGTSNDIPLHIGSRFGLSFLMNGLHDDLGLWSSALSSAEVLEIYNSGSVIDVSTDSGNYVSSSSLTGWWRMGDDDTLPTIIDNSTNSNNATTINVVAGDVITDVPS